MVTNFLAVAAPTGVWANLINWVHSWVGGSYGWTILVLIILLKLVLSPLDFLIKYSSKKTALVQQKTAPQIAKLQKKYGDNRQMIQTQTQALYKREGFNMYGSCIVMLINLVLTMVIFFTLFTGLRQLSTYQTIEQYQSLRETYVASVTSSYGTEEDYKLIAEKIADPEQGYDSLTDEQKQKWDQAKATAQEAVQEKWSDVAQNWLWVKNIWVNDGHTSPLPTFDSMKSMAASSGSQEYKEYVASIDYQVDEDGNVLSRAERFNYSNIAEMVEAKTGDWNGYYLLAVLAVLLSVASQWVNDLATKNKNKKAQAIVSQANPQSKSMWFMKLLIPVMMAIFVFTTNAGFGIYVVTNSVISTITGLLINVIVDAAFKKRQAEVDEFLAKEVNKIEKKQMRKGAK